MATLGEGNTSIVYLSVIDGKFAQRVRPDVVGVQKRTLKSGKVVYEKYYNNVKGIITKLELKAREYEGKTLKSLNITLDNEVQIQLSGGIDNAQNKNIINTLLSPQCKLDCLLVFLISRDQDGYSEVFIMQDDHGIKRFSNKENPNGVPQPVKKEKMGEVKWDWDAQNEWFYNQFQELAKRVAGNIAHQELDQSVAAQGSSGIQDASEPEEEKETTIEEFSDKEPEPTKEQLKENGKEDVNPDDIPF